MRYASIRNMDISNGEGLGITLFVQGCHLHCKNCFNKETWDFNGGKEWTEETLNQFIDLADKPFIKRISILGGEPLADENVKEVFNIVTKLRSKFKDTKKIWLYTGYYINDFIEDNDLKIPIEFEEYMMEVGDKDENIIKYLKYGIISNCDYVIDGPFIDELKDFNLKFRGSSNQTVIDIKKSLIEKKKIKYIE